MQEHGGDGPQESQGTPEESQGTPEGREPRPFSAIDPEPARRYQRRTVVRAGIALVAVCAVAAAVVVGVRLAKPARHPAAVTPAASFADSDGLIVFEGQPSGMLGAAKPDGSHQVIHKTLSALQGLNLPVASPDGHFLVNQEAQLVRVGANGPTTVTQLAVPDPQAENQAAQSGGLEWLPPTFADGSRYLAVTECDPIGQPASSTGEVWDSWLIPTAGGKPSSLGLVTSAAGIPGSAAVVAALPASPAAARQQSMCDDPDADGSLAILSAGKSPRVILTAAALVKAAGWKPSTPVSFSPYPNPDGTSMLVAMSTIASQQPGGLGTSASATASTSVQFIVSSAGRILSELPASTGQLFWSPDGSQAAFCQDEQGHQSSVTVLRVAGGTAADPRTITLPGRHDIGCTQLLWSPDGTQLIYSAFATSGGLTQADDLQHGWTVIEPASGKVHDVTAPGQPAAWLP